MFVLKLYFSTQAALQNLKNNHAQAPPPDILISGPIVFLEHPWWFAYLSCGPSLHSSLYSRARPLQQRVQYFKYQTRLFPGHNLGFISWWSDLTFDSFFAFLRLWSLTSEKNPFVLVALWLVILLKQDTCFIIKHRKKQAPPSSFSLWRTHRTSWPRPPPPARSLPSKLAGLWKRSTPSTLLSQRRHF